MVEIAEELGRRFGVHLADDTIDSMTTVDDAIASITGHPDLASKPAPTTSAAPSPQPAPVAAASTPLVGQRDIEEQSTHARSFIGKFAFFGAVVGGGLGVLMAAFVAATGIGSIDLVPIGQSAPATSTPTPTPTPTPTETSTTETPKPSIEASSSQVSPGARFYLTGSFPESSEGEDLQVEVREPGVAWSDFPIATKTRAGGEFRTELYTTRTGQREFRIVNKTTKQTTPSVEVNIG